MLMVKREFMKNMKDRKKIVNENIDAGKVFANAGHRQPPI